MSEFRLDNRNRTSCAAQSCMNSPSKDQTLTWHYLPKDKWLREKWIELLGIKDKRRNALKVCSSHFKPSDFIAYDKKTLRHYALPSVNLADDLNGTGSEEEYDDLFNLSSNEYKPFSTRFRKVDSSLKEQFSRKQNEDATPVRVPRSRKSALIALDKISKTLKNYDHDEISCSSSEEPEQIAEDILTIVSVYDKCVVTLNDCSRLENRIGDCCSKVVQEPKPKVIEKSCSVKEEPATSLNSEIDLAMECYEELLTRSQTEAYRKAKEEHNNIINKIAALKALNNAKVTYCSDPSILPPDDSITTMPINTSVDNLIIPDTTFMKTVTSNNIKPSTSLITVTETSVIIPSNKPVTQVSNSVSKINIKTTAVTSSAAMNGLTNSPMIIHGTVANSTGVNSTIPVLSYTNNLSNVNQQPLAILQQVSRSDALPQQSTVFLASNQTATTFSTSNTTSALQFVPGNVLHSSPCKFVVNSKTGAVLGTMTVDPITCNSVCKIPESAFSGASIQIVEVATLPTTMPVMTASAFPVKLLKSPEQSLLKTDNDTKVQNDSPKDNIKENETGKINSNEILSGQGIPTIYGGIGEITPHFILNARPSSLRDLNEAVIKHEMKKLTNELIQTEFTNKPIHWLINKKIIPSQPLCRSCSMGFLHLVEDKHNKDGYMWKCRNERCGRKSPVARLLFFDRFDSIPLRKAFALTYHWAVQSELNAVLEDASIDIQQLKLIWRAIQDVCARSVALKAKKLGGKYSIVEIGIARIGRLFVLGALDRETGTTRLKAFPSGIGWSLAVFYIEPWLHIGATVLSNNSNLDCLNQRGFHHVLVSSSKDEPSFYNSNNINRISKYLETHLSDTFGGYNVDQLRLVDLQAFLDELQWRERFGNSPISAFHYIFKDIVEQSGHKFKFKPEYSETLMAKQLAEKDNEKIPNKLLKVVTQYKTPENDESRSKTSSIKHRNTKDITSDYEHHEMLSSIKKVCGDFKSLLTAKCTHIMKTRNNGNKIPTTRWDSTESEIADNVIEVSKKEEKSLEPTKHTSLEYQKRKKKEDCMVALEEQYYATKNLSKKLLKHECKGNYQFKCLICKKIIENNIKVMKHINAHIDYQRQCKPALSDLTQCKYCFRDFDTPYNVQCHIESVHLKMNSLVCRICNLDFETIKKLEAHMQQFHSLSEMPYCCKICRYRSSFHEDIIRHFEEIHTGTDKVLCHYCLRIFHIKFSNIGLGFIQNYFYHLHKHQSKASAKKCTSCCLIFLSSSELREHRVQDHTSMKGAKGVKQLKSTFVMPVKEESTDKTVINSYPAAVVNTKSTIEPMLLMPKKKDKIESVKAVEDRADINILTVSERCCECHRPINPRHFGKLLTCGSCTYSTNCSKAFVDHMIIKHSRQKKTVKCSGMEIKPVVLETSMICDCGYSSTDGNALATHLVNCKKTSCHIKKSMKTVIKQEADGSWHIENVLDVSQAKHYSKDNNDSEKRLVKTENTCDDKSFYSTVSDVIDSQIDSSMDIPFVGNDIPDQEQKLLAQDESSQSEAQRKDKSRDMLNALGLVRKPISLLETKVTFEDAKESTEDLKDELLYCEVEESATKMNVWEEIEIIDNSDEPIILS